MGLKCNKLIKIAKTVKNCVKIDSKYKKKLWKFLKIRQKFYKTGLKMPKIDQKLPTTVENWKKKNRWNPLIIE